LSLTKHRAVNTYGRPQVSSTHS